MKRKNALKAKNPAEAGFQSAFVGLFD